MWRRLLPVTGNCLTYSCILCLLVHAVSSCLLCLFQIPVLVWRKGLRSLWIRICYDHRGLGGAEGSSGPPAPAAPDRLGLLRKINRATVTTKPPPPQVSLLSRRSCVWSGFRNLQVLKGLIKDLWKRFNLIYKFLYVCVCVCVYIYIYIYIYICKETCIYTFILSAALDQVNVKIW